MVLMINCLVVAAKVKVSSMTAMRAASVKETSVLSSGSLGIKDTREDSQESATSSCLLAPPTLLPAASVLPPRADMTAVHRRNMAVMEPVGMARLVAANPGSRAAAMAPG